MVNPKKVRFDGLDCTAVTTEIKSTLIGSKLANIYDGQPSSTSASNSNNTSTYIFKLVQSSSALGLTSTSSEQASVNNKFFLLIESGIRFHLSETQTKSSTGAMPSPFAMKLRKCLNNKRLESITQLGNLDRVIDLRFGSGTTGSYHLLLEFYAKGNIILTSHNYEILALLRSHEYNASVPKEKNESKDTGEVKVAVGQIYPVTFATTLGSSITINSSGEDHDNDAKSQPTSILNMDADQARIWIQERAVEYAKYKIENQIQNKGSKKKKKKNSDFLTLKMALLKQTSGVYHYGPTLLDHCILSSGLNPNLILNCMSCQESEGKSDADVDTNDLKLNPDVLSTSEISLLIDKLKKDGNKIIESLSTLSKNTQNHRKGYILYQKYSSTKNEKEKSNIDDAQTNSDKIFLEFQPHLLSQHQNFISSSISHSKTSENGILTCESFSQAVDMFFSHLDSQRRRIKASNVETAAKEKIANIKADQDSRMEALINEQASVKEDAQWIEQFADNIDDCLAVVNSALDSGMDWDDLEALVEVEQQNGNEVALLIHTLDLQNDAMVLDLQDEDEEDGRKVKILLGESAYQNARIKYDHYRQLKEKAEKTQDAHKKALQAAESTVQKQLMEVAKSNRGMNVGNLGMSASMPILERKPFWFEKFRWFITSDNYLVLAGRDAHQNETLVKRYLRPGDAYLHADVFGASSCILRAKRKRIIRSSAKNKNQKYSTQVLPLPEQALREAGHFTICHSSAWSTKMITSAWYVESHQVSKTAPSGEYLTVGSFMVRGKKNYLQPVHLEMGLGVLFSLGDAASIARHRGERRDFSLVDESDLNVNLMKIESNNNEAVVSGDENLEKLKTSGVSEVLMEERTNISIDHDEEKKSKLDNNETIPNKLAEPNLISSDDDTIEPIKLDQSSKAKAASNDHHSRDDSAKLNESNETVLADLSNPLSQDESQSTKSYLEDGTTSGSQLEQPGAKKKKKGFSVKERRLIKKYGSLEQAEKALAEVRAKETNKKSKPKQTQEVKQLTRGKKNKAKRIAKKYADQDDEDRELALLVLHGNQNENQEKKTKKKSSSNVAAPKKSSLQIKAAEETLTLLLKDTSKVAEKLPSEVRSILASCVSITPSQNGDKSIGENTVIRWDKFDSEVLEKLDAINDFEAQMAAVKRLEHLSKSTRIDNFAASLAGILRTIDRYGYKHLVTNEQGDGGIEEDHRTKQRKNKATKEAEKEAWNQILAEDGTLMSEDENGDENEAIDDTAELFKLTAKPLPEDIITSAVPVCAPYHTLSQYKYRIKLTPGSLKRGKAAKQCVDLLSNLPKNNGRQNGVDKNDPERKYQEFIKCISHNELVQVICGDVKITAPGASKLAKSHKKSKGKQKGGNRKKN